MRRAGVISILIGLCIVAAARGGSAAGAQAASDPALKWESEVRAYEKQDQATPPPQNATLFVGSSTIRIWKKLPEDFAPAPVIARGVGGCEMSDVLYYADRLILRYRPSRVVVYAGDNDIANHKTAGRVFADFKSLVARIRRALPGIRIYFLSIKPSPSREKLWPEHVKANRLVQAYARNTQDLAYIDTATPMLDAQGRPRPELFEADMLHMNRAGYLLWIPIIKAALAREPLGHPFPIRGGAGGGAPPWWDDTPTLVQTNSPTEAFAAHASAALCGAADDPNWGLFGQRQRIAGGGPGTVKQFHDLGIRALTWFEGFGTAGCYIAEMKRDPDGAWARSPSDPTLTHIVHNHWDWQLFDGAGEIRWVGAQNYFGDEDFARPYTRTHPRYGTPPMTYPDGRVAAGYSGPGTDPRSSRVLDAGCSKDVLGRITFEYEYNDAVNRIDRATGKPHGPLAGLLQTGEGPAGVPDPGFTPEEWASIHHQRNAGAFGAGKDSACPRWIDYARASVRAALDAGIDGLWVDNFSPWDSFNAKPILKAFGEWSVAGFRGYLRRHFSTTALRSLGITDLATFDVRRFLRDRCRQWGGDPTNLDDARWRDPRWRDDPIWRAYLIYKRQVGTEALKSYYRTIKEEAARAGKPDFLVSGNDIPLFSLGWPRGDLDMVSTELSWGWGLTTGARGLMPPPLGSYVPIYKLAREHTRGRYVNAWMYVPEAQKGKPNIANVLYCQALANNAGPMPDYPGKTAGTKAADAAFFECAREAAPILRECVPVEEVGLYYSSSSQLMEMLPGGFRDHADQPHSFSFFGWGTALTWLHVPWRTVPEWKLDGRTLRGLRALIIPSAEVFPTEAAATLGRFVRRGGGLIVAGMCGTRLGEASNFERCSGESTLAPLTRVPGRVVSLLEDPGLEFYKADKDRPGLLPAFRKVLASVVPGLGALSLAADSVPWTVGLTPYGSFDRVVVDVNNTDIDLDRDLIRPSAPVRFVLALPPGLRGGDLRARVLAPTGQASLVVRRIGEDRAEVNLGPVPLFARVILEPAR